MSLRLALGQLVDVPQFLVWKLNWNPNDHKFDKIPIHVHHPHVAVDISEKGNWLSFDQSQQWCGYLNNWINEPTIRYAMGFYLTDELGYWFLDIDHAVTNHVITPLANYFYRLLVQIGVMFEWSSSSRGMHFIGRGKLPEQRSIKNATNCLELYHENRGIAFGLTGQATGSVANDATRLMHEVICPLYFPPITHQYGRLTDNFDHPREDWYCNSHTDEELLMRMRRSSSVNAHFDLNKPTFSDLYDGNFPLLKTYYNGDESSYDFALAAHLAFWTGCHAPRIERFMRSSKLYRDKWDTHKTYLRDFTIRRACTFQKEVLQDKKFEATSVVTTPTLLTDSKGQIGEELTVADEQVQLVLFKDCIYVVEVHKIYVPVGNGIFRLLNADQFNSLFAKYTFKLDLLEQRYSYTKKAFDAFLGSKLVEFPKADFIKFNPLRAPAAVYLQDGARYINSYSPCPVVSKEGDPILFLKLIRKLYPEGDDCEILLSWMAACVQYVGKKFRWAPVLQGTQGSGKTILCECLSYAIGRQFVVTPKRSHIGKDFNAWIEGALLVVIHEMRQGKDYETIEDELKKLITDGTIFVEPKRRDPYTVENYANFIFTLNDKNNFKKSSEDRRFCLLYSAIQTVGDLSRYGLHESFFIELGNWLENLDGYAIVANYLKTYPIPTKFNPATHCMRAPPTSQDREVFNNARTYYEIKLMDAVDEQLIGFKHGWICFQRAKYELFKDKIANSKLEQTLEALDYVPHPNLEKNGWTFKKLIEEGRRVRLFCNKQIIQQTKHLKATEIIEQYERDQFS